MEKIIDDLRYYKGLFPKKALEKAVENKEEITPLLLACLDEILADFTIVSENYDYMLHFYSLYLLAQFREKGAFPKIIELISLEAEDIEYFFGDFITENLSSVLYSTYNGDLSLLMGVIDNHNIYIFVRGAVLNVLGKLYSDGEIDQEYLVNYLRQIIEDRRYGPGEEEVMHMFIQGIVINFRLYNLVEDIERLYREGRIDLDIYGDYKEFMYWVEEDPYEPVKYIEDVIAEMSWWACFQPEESLEIGTKGIKIGRNEPCPCGSGKKYKKCCGA